MRKRGARASVFVLAMVPPLVAVSSCLDFGSLSGSESDASIDGFVTIDSPIAIDEVLTSAIDSASDAGVEAGFCASNPGHTLCDDFDDLNFLTPFSGRAISEGGLGVQASDEFVSPLFSYRATLPEVDAATESWLVNKFPTVQDDLRIEFDVSLVTAGTSTTAITEVFFPGGYSFTLRLQQPNPPTLQLVEALTSDGGAVYANVSNISYVMTINVWHHIFVDIQLAGPNVGKIQFSFDHAAVIDTVAPMPFAFGDAGTVQLQAGIASYSSGPYFSSSVRLDNYVVDLK